MKIIKSISNKINQIKQDNENYNNLLANSNTFQNLKPIPILESQIVDYKINIITNTCPDINKDKAIIINKLIPIEETYLTVCFLKEILTNKEYYIIPTDKYIWLLDNNNYLIFNYPQVPICSIVKNILMGKIINLNNIILEITGTDKTITNFINIINNPTYRQEQIKEKTNYLCGVTPNIQIINNIGSGITLDNQNNIVFHTKNNNYKCSINDIKNYELLFDNSIVYSKELNSTTRVTVSHNDCYSMTIRITLNDKTFIMPILEPNALNTKYTKQDSTFQTNQIFAYSILSKLKELTEKGY